MSVFEVSAEETIALAQVQGLQCVLSLRAPSVQQVNRDAGVMWSRLAFSKSRPKRRSEPPFPAISAERAPCCSATLAGS